MHFYQGILNDPELTSFVLSIKNPKPEWINLIMGRAKINGYTSLTVISPIISNPVHNSFVDENFHNLIKPLFRTAYEISSKAEKIISEKLNNPDTLKKIMPLIYEGAKTPIAPVTSMFSTGMKIWFQNPISAQYPELIDQIVKNDKIGDAINLAQLVQYPHWSTNRLLYENILRDCRNCQNGYDHLMQKGFRTPETLKNPDILVDFIHVLDREYKFKLVSNKQLINSILNLEQWKNYPPFQNACKGDPTYDCLVKKSASGFRLEKFSLGKKIKVNCEAFFHYLGI
jgi:hypothetical protein